MSRTQYFFYFVTLLFLSSVVIATPGGSTDSVEREIILSERQHPTWAYYTDISDKRWYISYIARQKTGIYSLGPIVNNQASWWTVAENAAMFDYDFKFLSTNANLSKNQSTQFLDIGTNTYITSSSILSDRQLIENSQVGVKWYFFRAKNGYWYIVNAEGYGSISVRRFGSSGSSYQWTPIDMTGVTTKFSTINNEKFVDFLAEGTSGGGGELSFVEKFANEAVKEVSFYDLERKGFDPKEIIKQGTEIAIAIIMNTINTNRYLKVQITRPFIEESMLKSAKIFGQILSKIISDSPAKIFTKGDLYTLVVDSALDIVAEQNENNVFLYTGIKTMRLVTDMGIGYLKSGYAGSIMNALAFDVEQLIKLSEGIIEANLLYNRTRIAECYNKTYENIRNFSEHTTSLINDSSIYNATKWDDNTWNSYLEINKQKLGWESINCVCPSGNCWGPEQTIGENTANSIYRFFYEKNINYWNCRREGQPTC